jgi:hypothetical protein
LRKLPALNRATLEDFRLMVRAALGGSVASEGREVILWSNAQGSAANEQAAMDYRAGHPETILLSETEAGRQVAELVTRTSPSPEQADVIWGLLSHRFAMAAQGIVHAFVSGSATSRTFRAVEAREVAERRDGRGLLLHENGSNRLVDPDEIAKVLTADAGDFFVTRDPDEQIIVIEEAERLRPRKSRSEADPV